MREALARCSKNCDYKKCEREAELLLEVPLLKKRLIRSFQNAKNISARIRRSLLEEYEKKRNELNDLMQRLHGR